MDTFSQVTQVGDRVGERARLPRHGDAYPLLEKVFRSPQWAIAGHLDGPVGESGAAGGGRAHSARFG